MIIGADLRYIDMA